jgi:hypothetical protein
VQQGLVCVPLITHESDFNSNSDMALITSYNIWMQMTNHCILFCVNLFVTHIIDQYHLNIINSMIKWSRHLGLSNVK